MSDLFTISPKGAFSCEWNKGIDRKAFCGVKLVISMYAFFTALLSKYTVRISEVRESFLENNSDHYNSVFGKEYRKTLIAMRSCLKDGEVDVSKRDREALGSVLVEDVTQLIKNKKFRKAIDSIKGNKMGLIKPKDCCRLFMMASEHPNKVLTSDELISDRFTLAYQLIETEHCYELVNSLCDKEENPLSFLLDNILTSGPINKLADIIRHCPATSHLIGEDGITPLMMFAKNGIFIDIMSMLIVKGENINVCDKNGMTALHYAASNHQLSSIGILLNKRYEMYGLLIDVNARNNEGMTALHLSVRKENDKMDKNNGECSKRLILTGKFNINAKDNNQRTPLHIACMEISNKVIDSLLDLDNILLNEKDCDGRTPLHCIVTNCKKSVVIKLLEKGGSISINAKDNVGNTPLHYTHAYGYDIILALLDAGANSKQANDEGKTPFMEAKEVKNKKVIDLYNNHKKKNNKTSPSSGKESSGSDGSSKGKKIKKGKIK